MVQIKIFLCTRDSDVGEQRSQCPQRLHTQPLLVFVCVLFKNTHKQHQYNIFINTFINANLSNWVRKWLFHLYYLTRRLVFNLRGFSALTVFSRLPVANGAHEHLRLRHRPSRGCRLIGHISTSRTQLERPMLFQMKQTLKSEF